MVPLQPPNSAVDPTAEAAAGHRRRSAVRSLFCWGSYTRAVQLEWDRRCSYGTPEVATSMVCPRRRAGRLRTGDPSTQRNRIRVAAV
jgi:hypothetical protein